MKVNWFNTQDIKNGKMILVGDVGGTNTNLGFALAHEDKIDLVFETVFSSHEVTDFLIPIQKTIDTAHSRYPDLQFDLCCISAAGPVKNNICQMTNQSWLVDGNRIQEHFKVSTIIINDFSAISFGIPLLNIQDTKQILPLPRPDGHSPVPKGDLMAVVGAGTGLGVGFINKINDKYRAFASEGGHMDFAGFDPVTKGFQSWIQDKIDLAPEYEMAISGSGIKNLFYYFFEIGELKKEDALVQEVMALPDLEKPELISKNSFVHDGFRKIMETFVKIYARFAASVACLLMPSGGFYLAGGISGKNLDHFTKDNLFTRTFEEHCNPNIVNVLRDIPLYIIKDYSISLYGAANAALSLIRKT